MTFKATRFMRDFTRDLTRATYALSVGLPLGLMALAAPAAARDGGETREVTVLHMADTHAALDVHPEIFLDAEGKPTFRPAGGYALLSSAIRKEREAEERRACS